MPAPVLPLIEAAAHWPARGALVGLDLGTKTIGVAVSDPDRRLATGVGTIHRKAFKADAARLLVIAAERAATGFVLGLPINMQQSAVGVCRHLKARRMRRAIHRRDIVETNLDLVLDVIALPLRMLLAQQLGNFATGQVGGESRLGDDPAFDLFQKALVADAADACIDALIIRTLVVLIVDRDAGGADDNNCNRPETHVSYSCNART